MRRFTGIATLLIWSLAGLLLPAYAQHGGGHGGFSSHAGGHAGSGISGGMRSSAGGHPMTARPMAPGRPSSPGAGARTGYGFQDQTSVQGGVGRGQMGIVPGTVSRYAPRAYGMNAARPNIAGVSPYRRAYRSPNSPTYSGSNFSSDRHRNHGGIVYGYRPGLIAPYYFGYPLGLGFFGDDDYYDDFYNDSPSPYEGPDQYNGFDPQSIPPDQMQYRIEGQEANPYPDQYSDQSEPQGPHRDQYPNQIPPGTAYQPFYGAPDSSRTGRATPSPRPAYNQIRPLPSEPAITLVFNDRRPNQVIHNYLINGGTLTVWDQSAHDIPIAQINVEATRQVNKDKGIDFILPNASY